MALSVEEVVTAYEGSHHAQEPVGTSGFLRVLRMNLSLMLSVDLKTV